MKLTGIIVPLLTPMHENGHRINYDAIEPCVEFLISKGVHGFFVNGTTGEAPLLSLEERKKYAEAVISLTRKRIPVIVQVGTLSTRDSAELASHAADAGADAVASTPPYYFAYSDEALENYFVRVAESAGRTDFYLYTIPSRTVNQVSTTLAERLSTTANVVGIKDSTGDVAQLLAYLAISDFTVLCGSDVLASSALEMGASGTVSSPAGMFPEPYVALWQAHQAGDKQRVLYWHSIILRILHLTAYGSKLGVLKFLADLRIGSIGSPRSPIPAALPAEMEPTLRALHNLLRDAGLPDEVYCWLAQNPR